MVCQTRNKTTHSEQLTHGDRIANFSVYEAFNRGLPNIINKNERPDVSTGQGGIYTAATDSPKVWVQLQFDERISKAIRFVESVKEKLVTQNIFITRSLPSLRMLLMNGYLIREWINESNGLEPVDILGALELKVLALLCSCPCTGTI